MAPQATVEALRALNFPNPFVSLLGKAWRQQRWVTYQGHVHHRPLVARQATPQGCPVAPMILALWISCGIRSVEAQCRRNLKHFAYMDDRSFTADSVEDINDAIQSWMTWSQKVNLKESPAKTQVCSRNKHNQEQLLATWPQWTKTDVKVLGATTAGRPRVDSPSESQRIQAAHCRAQLLMAVPLPWDLKIKAFQAFVMSKAAFGWIGRWPTKRTSESLFGMLTKALGTGKGAARALRKMRYGSVSYLHLVILTRTWAPLYRAIQKGRRPCWKKKAPHTALHLLRRHLKDLGFVETAPYLWKVTTGNWKPLPGTERVDLDLREGSLQELGLQPHNLRLLYKQSCFDSFLDKNRRDSREIAQGQSAVALRTMVKQLDQKQLRNWLTADAAGAPDDGFRLESRGPRSP